MATQSRSEHILELAKELLDDIELSRTDAEKGVWGHLHYSISKVGWVKRTDWVK